MARTAVVNPRRRRRRKSNPKRRSHKRRRNYGSAALVAREPNRRRRRRSYGGARRRRNPSRLSRRRNPGHLDLDTTIEIVPPATAGVWAARWAVAQAGEFENGEPGIKHALAIWLAASFGADLIGSVFGDSKAQYARIAALGYGGDLFLRKRFMKDSEWAKKNVYLGDDGEPAGGQYVDAVGNTWVETNEGWQLSGVGADGGLYEDAEGNVFQLGAAMPYGAGFGAFESGSPLMGMGAFESTSPLAGYWDRDDRDVRASSESSFGYA